MVEKIFYTSFLLFFVFGILSVYLGLTYPWKTYGTGIISSVSWLIFLITVILLNLNGHKSKN